MIGPRRCRWGKEGSVYWAHRGSDHGRCEVLVSHVYALCPRHYRAWRDMPADWKKLMQKETTHD